MIIESNITSPIIGPESLSQKNPKPLAYVKLKEIVELHQKMEQSRSKRTKYLNRVPSLILLSAKLRQN